MSLSAELQERGFIHQISSENLAEILDGQPRTVYLGIDPTADSIHVGNLATFMLLRHLAGAGHKTILLVGGGTGLIGDPKPDQERTLSTPEETAEKTNKLLAQAETLLSTTEVTFVNNYEWLSEVDLITFLRDIGKHFTINELIKKEAIARRVSSDHGISYTEFAYPLLQAFDYLQLHQRYGCDLQIGGSDQWGNIISGVELVRRKLNQQVFGITTPLIIDKTTGKKFGKSEGNAVWLDGNKTPPYTFYQFWLNVSDENVFDYLKIFTTIPLPEIQEIMDDFNKNPGSRAAQKKLAFCVTELIHGKVAATNCANVSAVLFGGQPLSTIDEAEKVLLLENAPTFEIDKPEPLVDLLVMTHLASSKREARTFIEDGAVFVNREKVASLIEIGDQYRNEELVLLQRGKKQMCILRLNF